jgi:frataxin-like iron-binding protein CyaY
VELLKAKMNDDAEFQRRAGDALKSLLRVLAPAADDFGFRASLSGEALTVDFGPAHPAVVVAPHPAARQIWITGGPKTRKLAWDVVDNAFVLEATGQDLQQVVEEVISLRVGEDVTL